ncbi:hypothetical protein C8Q74DRAFT_1242956 [Fomes fomentarius]|nr:hypothetical protein C8Q74DRAFT_1242956 [Fomes fomentarius]
MTNVSSFNKRSRLRGRYLSLLLYQPQCGAQYVWLCGSCSRHRCFTAESASTLGAKLGRNWPFPILLSQHISDRPRA